MIYKLISTNRFKKSLKLAIKRNLDITLLNSIIDTLRQNIPLEAKYKDHNLIGSYSEFRECHIQPNWLLVYLKNNNTLTLTLIDTGSHSDIFK